MHSRSPHASKRVLGYDVLRVVAILAVVAIHVLMVYRGTLAENAPVSLLDGLLHFAVPAFYFVSGALVWGRYSGTTSSDYSKFLKGRAGTVLAPYVAWSALYLFIAAVRGDWPRWIAESPLLLLTGRSWYHLYFIPVLILFYLLTPLVAPLVRRRPELLVVIAYMARLFLELPVAELASRVGGPNLVVFAVAATTHLSSMALGAWFAVRKDRVLPVLRVAWPALLGAGGVLYLARSASLLPPSIPTLLDRSIVPAAMTLMILGLTGLAFSIRMSRSTGEKVSGLGTLAFGVYFVHPAFLLAWDTVIDAVGAHTMWQSAWFAIVSILAIAAASVAISALLARNPATSWLVGLRAGRHRA